MAKSMFLASLETMPPRTLQAIQMGFMAEMLIVSRGQCQNKIDSILAENLRIQSVASSMVW